MHLVLVAIKNEKLAQSVISSCHDRGAKTQLVSNLVEAKTSLADPGTTFSSLILDLNDIGSRSEKKLASILSSFPSELSILGIGSNFDLKTVTALYRSGLNDYLNLPPDPLELSKALDNILGRLENNPVPHKISAKVTSSESSISPNEPLLKHQIIGSSSALMKVFRMVEKVATTDSTVLLQGESGTGKELIARAIHLASLRKDKPLIPINCGAIPEELLETELFGHVKGAFTNAIRERIGRFEMAAGGTIFLDEIGDMSPKLQVKLLRVLQEHEIERVGGDKPISVDIRVITATHVDLTKAVIEGRFREDLFYRLNVIPVTMPPLRERRDDIPILIDFFLTRLRQTRGSKVTSIDSQALQLLMAYKWPGNIRELENLVERMVILAESQILTIEDLPQRLLEATQSQVKEIPLPKLAQFMEPEIETTPVVAPIPETNIEPEKTAVVMNERTIEPIVRPFMEPLLDFPSQGLDLTELLNNYELLLIRSALTMANGVKTEAARLLGLNRTTFLEKLRKKGLDS